MITDEQKQKKVVFCTPTVTRPFDAYLDALEASIPLIKAAGWDEGACYNVGSPYISHARSKLTREALNAEADVIVYIDHDVSWAPRDLLTLVETEGDVVAGTYRYKLDNEEYMGVIVTDDNDRPIVREDGCIRAQWVPAGFLKVTKAAIHRFMRAYPGLCYGDPDHYSIDLFNHGAIDGVWFGEDAAFCKRWNELGGDIWLVPNLDLDHHSGPSGARSMPAMAYKGNFHAFLLKQPGGSEDGRA
jgi:hypothetical protein